MPSRVISRDGRPVMSRPSKRIVPLLGVRWPVIMLTKVVLPAPLAPMMPTVCCGGTATVMSRAAITEPKVFSRSRTARISRHDALAALRAAAREQRAEPFRQEQDGQQQRGAERSSAKAGHVGDGERAHQLEHQRADEGRGDRAGAGQDRDEDEAAGRRPVGHVGIDMADRERGQRAAEAGKHAGDHDLDVDQPVDRDAEKLDADLVVADRRRERAGDRCGNTAPTSNAASAPSRASAR